MPHTFTKLTPNLVVADVGRSLAFYRDVLGLEVVGRDLVSDVGPNSTLAMNTRQRILLIQVPKEELESKETPGIQVPKEHKAHKEQLEHKELLDCRVTKVPQAIQVPMEHKEHKEQKELMEHKEQKVFKVTLDRKDFKE